jgi:hypothetical protein
MKILLAEKISARQKGRSLQRKGSCHVFAFFFAPVLIVRLHAAELSSQALKVEVSSDAVKALPGKDGTKELSGRLVTFKDGSMVFRTAGLTKDIPVKAPNGNPFQDNIKNAFAKEQSASELVGTVPVTVKIPHGDNRSVEVKSNVGQVWNQISSGFKNRSVADKFQHYVADYEASTSNILAGSSKGWVGTFTPTATAQTPAAKPESVMKLQQSVATDIFDIVNSSPDKLTRDDFARSTELIRSSDPDQLFGSYGPVYINWSLDNLRQFTRAASSVAAISYLGAIKGTGFLIGNGLLLTCDHVARVVDLNSATATFQSPEEGQPAITLSFESQPVMRSSTLNLTSKVSSKKLHCDFALLKLKNSEALGQAGIRPLEIWNQAPLNAVVAVVGYPETFKRLTIHDNGTMLFPYLLPRREFENIFVQRVNRSLFLSSAPATTNDAAFSAQMRSAQTSFCDTYGYHKEDGPNTNYFYVGREDEWKDVPSFGVDTSDTHGDSGGAVFDKTTLRIIGILRGGPEGSFSTGSWFKHDRVIPITEVIDSITQADSNLLTTYGVSVSP